MKGLVLCFALLFSLQFVAQDKVYLLDGQKLEGTVTEISDEKITLLTGSMTREIQVSTIVLVEFQNGRTEVFNRAAQDHYLLNGRAARKPQENSSTKLQNECYINTLALVNADLSVYYEYRFIKRAIGTGLMGTYNFNRYATLPNVFIGILNNGKKRFDAAAFINFYSGSVDAGHKMYLGFMLKYTAFDFTAVKEDSIYSNNTVSVLVNYEEASGSQLSFLFNIGSHHNITENLFIKTSFAFGFFALNGIYKEQLNYALRNSETGVPANFSILPKASLGLCVGVKF
ncbi:MAG: hypothetical protein JNK73_11240 [Bacteroidia bacterium]|nr:hypothetical protein [Bacteroidia bacterium]